MFQQCPAGYCCSGGDSAPCITYSSCAGNRSGVLCGACQVGFTISIVNGECTPNKQCGKDQWFWLLTLLALFAYVLWYTCKDNLFSFVFRGFKQFRFCVPKSVFKDVVPNTTVSEMDDTLTKKDQSEKDQAVDKGYFGILTYFIQMTAAIKIHIEFSDVDKSTSILDTMLMNIGAFLNIDIMNVQFDVCPIVGLTTLGKQLYQMMFLLGIYISWVGMFLFVLIIIEVLQKKEYNVYHLIMLKSFKSLLIRGLVEIIKYTYSGFCGITFMSLLCVKIGSRYVWWYDGTINCLQNWQITMVVFGISYAISFPLALFLGMRLLKRQQISSGIFFCCCLCPFTAVWYNYRHSRIKNTEAPSTVQLSEAGGEVISVLQGPYREDERNITLYWEAVVSMRRLAITVMTLISNPSIRMVGINVFCIAFLYQHVHFSPFQVRTSNYVEGLSLSLLLVTSVINLLKACLTDSGIVPSGPSVPFFKGLELCEKVFIFLVIAYILMIEVHKKNFKKRK